MAAHGWTRRAGRAALLAFPGLALAGLGFSHPDRLDAHSAEWWTTLHLILIALFPLLGVALWAVVRGIEGWAAWAARIAAFGYMVLYGALDVLAGVATGTLVKDGTSPGAPEVASLFAIGNDLADAGTWLFLVACAICTYLTYQRGGRAALPGGVILVAAAVFFMDSHIYWPTGVLSCVGLAVGLGWLGAVGSPPEGASASGPTTISARGLDAIEPTL